MLSSFTHHSSCLTTCLTTSNNSSLDSDLLSSVIYFIWRIYFSVYWYSVQYIYIYDEIWLVSIGLPLWVVPVCWPELLSFDDGTIGSLFAATDPCSTSCHNGKCPDPADALWRSGWGHFTWPHLFTSWGWWCRKDMMHAHGMPLNGKWKGTEFFMDFNSRPYFNRKHILGFPIYAKLCTSFYCE